MKIADHARVVMTLVAVAGAEGTRADKLLHELVFGAEACVPPQLAGRVMDAVWTAILARHAGGPPHAHTSVWARAARLTDEHLDALRRATPARD